MNDKKPTHPVHPDHPEVERVPPKVRPMDDETGVPPPPPTPPPPPSPPGVGDG